MKYITWIIMERLMSQRWLPKPAELLRLEIAKYLKERQLLLSSEKEKIKMMRTIEKIFILFLKMVKFKNYLLMKTELSISEIKFYLKEISF